MILKRFSYDKLAQVSYLVGCQASGEALVVDPNRGVDLYIREAAGEGLRIAHVTETHIHADFLSGARELSERTGARLYLSGEGGEDWRYRFSAPGRTVILRNGDRFMAGAVQVEALHTPGHTPEHLSFLLTDTAGADRPMGAFTGDFVFVGAVGRPDLLERAVEVRGTMEASARELFRSLRRFAELPDWLQLWPAHGAGSACGKGLGAVPQSTLGYEKRFNPWFADDDEERFARAILEGQPDPPRYFGVMKRLNRDGPPLLRGRPCAPRLAPERLVDLLLARALVLDLRPAAAFAAGFVPGTLHLPLNRSFPTWAGWFVPYDRDIHLIVPEERAEEAVLDLAMIGLDRVGGTFGVEAVAGWEARGGRLATIPQIRPDELAGRLKGGSVAVIDVRWAPEWEAGRLPGVPNIPLGDLPARLEEVPGDRPLVLQCQTGGRSMIAASLLHARGFRDVANLAGGFAEWRERGHPVERPRPAAAGDQSAFLQR